MFYPGDWMKDPELRSVSLAARGLWMDMLCLMFEGGRRGYLVLGNGKPVTNEKLARMTGTFEAKVIQYLEELEESGVLSRDKDGIIYSRRLIRDEEKRSSDTERQKEHRLSQRCHKLVTPSVTPLSVNESEYENESEVETKKERKQFVESEAQAPEGMGASVLAIGLLEHLQLVSSPHVVRVVQSAIEIASKAKLLTLAESCDWLLMLARLAQEEGEKVDRFWFEGGVQVWQGKVTTQAERERQRQRDRSQVGVNRPS